MIPLAPDEIDHVFFKPEADPLFRMTQLLLVLVELGPDGEQVDRLVYIDFLASHPFLVVGDGDRAWSDLVLLGFETRSLDYLSPAQLFATRREQVGRDLARLLAYGLAAATQAPRSYRYTATPSGIESAALLSAMYADSIRESTRVVAPKVRRLTDKALATTARSWFDAGRSDMPGLIADLNSPTTAVDQFGNQQ